MLRGADDAVHNAPLAGRPIENRHQIAAFDQAASFGSLKAGNLVYPVPPRQARNARPRPNGPTRRDHLRRPLRKIQRPIQRNTTMHVLPLSILATILAVSATAHAAPNVETLPSGVRIEHVTLGNGASPSATSNVTVHYRGTLVNGTEFDSSFKRNQPATFGLNQVIPCWTQGVQKMKVGGTAKLTCPPETAYGSRNLGSIPPNSVLNFEIQLLDSK